MKTITYALAGLALAALPLAAQALDLQPANPQPTGLKGGLKVAYAFPSDVKTLSQAAKFAKRAQPGKPLAGLDYTDTNTGDETLTSGQATNVVADISGYVKFDNKGTYVIDFLSNDGLKIDIGGQEIAYFDGRHPCQATRKVEVNVPQAGWYELKALYFQRNGTACLHMRAGQGTPDWMPNSAFGYK